MAAEPVSLVADHVHLRAGSDLFIASSDEINGSDTTGQFRGWAINWAAIGRSLNFTTTFALYEPLGSALAFTQTFHSNVEGTNPLSIRSAKVWGSPS